MSLIDLSTLSLLPLRTSKNVSMVLPFFRQSKIFSMCSTSLPWESLIPGVSMILQWDPFPCQWHDAILRSTLQSCRCKIPDRQSEIRENHAEVEDSTNCYLVKTSRPQLIWSKQPVWLFSRCPSSFFARAKSLTESLFITSISFMGAHIKYIFCTEFTKNFLHLSFIYLFPLIFPSHMVSTNFLVEECGYIWYLLGCHTGLYISLNILPFWADPGSCSPSAYVVK